MQLHQAHPCDVSAMWTVYALYVACRQEPLSWWRTADHLSDITCSHWWLYDLPTCNDKCLSCMDYSLCFADQTDTVIFYRMGIHGHLPSCGIACQHRRCVCKHCSAVTLPYLHNLAQKFRTTMSSIGRNC